VRVKSPVRQSRPPHHLIHTRFRHSTLTKRLPRCLKNPAARRSFVFGWISHEKILLLTGTGVR